MQCNDTQPSGWGYDKIWSHYGGLLSLLGYDPPYYGNEVSTIGYPSIGLLHFEMENCPFLLVNKYNLTTNNYSYIILATTDMYVFSFPCVGLQS